MNLNTIAEVKRPASADQITEWRDGYAWLAGGTWLFSEPQVSTDTLIDLERLIWPALESSPAGLDIAATCRIAGSTGSPAGGMARDTARARVLRRVLASFKIWNAATVGGNICMSLPAGPMISLTVALDATYTLWPRNAPARDVHSVARYRKPHQHSPIGRIAPEGSTCPHPRCRGDSRFGTPRSRTSGGRRRC
jgi:CO/xanthine dehydrogenase FAD-binding subunit